MDDLLLQKLTIFNKFETLLNKMEKKFIKNLELLRKKNSHYKHIISIFLSSVVATMGFDVFNLQSKLYANQLEEFESNDYPNQSFVAKAISISGPAIVTIETQRKVISNNSLYLLPKGYFIDPYFEHFFNLPKSRIPNARIEKGQGSGVIISNKGLVLTNAHVINKTDRLTIGLSDGRRVTGKILGQDYLTDLAVIQLKGSGPWPTAQLGNSDKLRVGDWAIAVGNPFGLENTVTLGIISNVNRNANQLGISDRRLDLIQTDAAINPGNSGGPLLNANGQVIGINMLVRSGPGAGLGFAIPINHARKIAKEIIEKGKAIHPMIGVSLTAIEESFDEKNNYFKETKTVVTYVIPEGPAYKSGLKKDDIILSINNIEINSPSDVVNTISNNGINTFLKFKIKRNKKIIKLSIKPIDMNQIKYKDFNQ